MWRHRKELQPLSGFLLGPTKGSLSSAIWDEVCPPNRVKNVTFDVPYEQRWDEVKRVLTGPENCIYVETWILNWGYVCIICISCRLLVHLWEIGSWNRPPSMKYGLNIGIISAVIIDGLRTSQT